MMADGQMDENPIDSSEAIEPDEIKKLKTWLFRENIRIQNEKAELEAMREKLIEDKVTFRNEMNILNNRMTIEQKRIREESQFLDKKMQIIQDGFKKLEIDRKYIDSEMKALEIKKKEAQFIQHTIPDGNKITDILFRNVKNNHGLQKRYRDLLKIFHPDNNDGDAELVQLINQEYDRRRGDK